MRPGVRFRSWMKLYRAAIRPSRNRNHVSEPCDGTPAPTPRPEFYDGPDLNRGSEPFRAVSVHTRLRGPTRGVAELRPRRVGRSPREWVVAVRCTSQPGLMFATPPLS